MITVERIKQEIKTQNLKSVSGIESDLEFLLWDLSEMDELNKGYEVEKFHGGHYAIGSNGGLEILTVEFNTGIVYRIPFISTDNSEKIKVSDSITELIKLN
ncbi:hypothetical protein [Confluentibacter citreus]|uniref:hypothetical protein n=1 Tax=Confluentibacter citreus TaxID=2007307 RepID=UPI000C287702|nr:hypothetical protein [Confluentibacter citreus]